MADVGVRSCFAHFRDLPRLGLGGPSPPKDVAAPSNWNGNRSSLHGYFGHHANSRLIEDYLFVVFCVSGTGSFRLKSIYSVA